MPDQEKQIEAFLQKLLATRQMAQILRVRDHWEPEIVAALTGMADDSLALLRQHLSGAAGATDSGTEQDQTWLADQIAALKEGHVQHADLLSTVRQALDRSGRGVPPLYL